MKNIKYPLVKSTISYDEVKELSDWLLTDPRLTQGDLVREFEEKFSTYIGRKYSVFVNSGSSANLLMYRSAAVAGKFPTKHPIIIVPSCGWATTISPLFDGEYDLQMVGSDADTWGIDLNVLEAMAFNTLGCVFVQVLGIPHKKEILDIKNKNGIFLFEDACASQGAEYSDGTKVGCIGDVSSFSFYFGHQMSTIEGGMVCTDDFDIYQTALSLRSHGWQKDLEDDYRDNLFANLGIVESSFNFIYPGFNLRSTDLQAKLGIMQLDNIVERSNIRTTNHYYYASRLSDYGMQKWFDNIPCSIHFPILLESTEERSRISLLLNENGVETRNFDSGNLGRHYFWYSKYGKFSDSVSDKLYNTGLFLPNNPEMTTADIDIITDLIKYS